MGPALDLPDDEDADSVGELPEPLEPVGFATPLDSGPVVCFLVY